MAQHIVKINSIKYITHDVLQIVTDKPEQFTFTPGQATEISINKNGSKDERSLSLLHVFLTMITLSLSLKHILRIKVLPMNCFI